MSELFNKRENDLKEYAKKIDCVLRLEDNPFLYENKFGKISQLDFLFKTQDFKKRLEKGASLNDILVEAFALCREACRRTIGEFPYKSQLIGAYVLNNGDISEQPTGSGKTLTAVLAAYLNALEGKGVHIITTNEYLAKRDYEKMKQVFNFLGISVGLNLSGMSPSEKKRAYRADVTYTSCSELGFDYLRDNMIYRSEDKVLRGLNFAIIDEVDSVLVDDGSTPLIISGGVENNNEDYINVDRKVKLLIAGKDLEIDDDQRTFMLSEEGIKKLEKMFNVDNLFDEKHVFLNHLVRQAITANFMLDRDVDYIVNSDNQVMIVDPNTGRTMEGRKWSNGLHQAVEAKEGVAINSENKTVASITYQNFFRQYNKLAGMSGTCDGLDEELLNTYNMLVYHVPSNNKIIRVDDGDRVFNDKQSKYRAIVNEVIRIHKSGRPILIGVGSVESSLELSKYLDTKRIKHSVLNAKNDEKEADIISHAGERYAVTIATNMAGRGTDIKLKEGVKKLGGLVVIGGERFFSKRVDDQLRGRSGRQGDPGYTCFYSSLEDELFVTYGNKEIKKLNYKKALRAVDSAQKLSESEKYDSRMSLLEYDNIISDFRNCIYASRDIILNSDNIHDYIRETFVLTVNRIVNQKWGKFNRTSKKNITSICNEINELCGVSILPTTIFKKKKMECIEYVANVLLNTYEGKLSNINGLEDVEKNTTLKYIDMMWSDYICQIEDLRNNISLRSYGQLDPKKEFLDDAHRLFDMMLDELDRSIVKFFVNVKVVYE